MLSRKTSLPLLDLTGIIHSWSEERRHMSWKLAPEVDDRQVVADNEIHRHSDSRHHPPPSPTHTIISKGINSVDMQQV